MIDPKKLEERETWHKIVVKVIQWKSDQTNLSILKTAEKISLPEWRTYRSHILKTNSNDRTKALKKLENAQKRIKSLGGFA